VFVYSGNSSRSANTRAAPASPLCKSAALLLIVFSGSKIIGSHDDDRLIIQSFPISSKRLERRCELSAECFRGAGFSGADHMHQAVPTEFIPAGSIASLTPSLYKPVARQSKKNLRFIFPSP
jgi:hypothetical protein